MYYPISFRRKVLARIEEGMSKREAARLFKVSPQTIYNCLQASDLKPRLAKYRHRKIDKEALLAHVKAHPDMLLRERAKVFKVSVSGLSYVLKAMNIRKKKQKRYLERDNMKRSLYIGNLRYAIAEYGSDNIIYFDESVFEQDVQRDSGWAQRGTKIYGDVRGGKNPRTNLIMAQRRKSKEWLAPILFEGSWESTTVLWWIKEYLLSALSKPSVIVMDNAPFHPVAKIRTLLAKEGHKLLCLPKYSPDLNPIEQSFGAMKTNWKNADENTTLDTIVTSKC